MSEASSSPHPRPASRQEVGEALEAASAYLEADARPPTAEELAVCEGLCALVTSHQSHQDEDVFPRLAAQHPELGPVLRALRLDHAAIARLVQEVRDAAADGRHVVELHHRVNDLRTILLTHLEAEARVLPNGGPATAVTGRFG